MFLSKNKVPQMLFVLILLLLSYISIKYFTPAVYLNAFFLLYNCPFLLCVSVYYLYDYCILVLHDLLSDFMVV